MFYDDIVMPWKHKFQDSFKIPYFEKNLGFQSPFEWNEWFVNIYYQQLITHSHFVKRIGQESFVESYITKQLENIS